MNINVTAKEKYIYDDIIKEMIEQAAKPTVYYGIPILAHQDEKDTYYHIFFSVDGHNFESLKDLRKALRNKVLL
jgi:hypothetical protein